MEISERAIEEEESEDMRRFRDLTREVAESYFEKVLRDFSDFKQGFEYINDTDCAHVDLLRRPIPLPGQQAEGLDAALDGVGRAQALGAARFVSPYLFAEKPGVATVAAVSMSS